jgi:hypothetical protein
MPVAKLSFYKFLRDGLLQLLSIREIGFGGVHESIVAAPADEDGRRHGIEPFPMSGNILTKWRPASPLTMVIRHWFELMDAPAGETI